MKTFVLAILAVLIALSYVAWSIKPQPEEKGRLLLTWATDNNPVRQAQADLFNKLNPDLKIVIDPANRDQQKVVVQAVGGVGPDVFDCYGANYVEAYVRSGVAMDITDEMLASGIDVEKIIWPVVKPIAIYNRRVYGFPCNAGGNAIWYNKDLFDEAGVPYPKKGWTWEDLIDTAAKLTVRDKSGKPVRFGIYWDFWASFDLIYRFGGRQFSDDFSKCIIDSPEAIAAVQFSRDLMFKHRVAPTPTEEATLSTQGGWGSGGITFLMGKRVAMAWGGRWWLNLLRKEKGLRLGVAELPAGKVDIQTGGGRSTLVNRLGKHTKEAIRFIKFLASKEYNELLNDQADAMSPVKSYCYTDRFLHNPEHPEEDFNAVWRSIAEKSVQAEINPFAQGAELAPLNNQMDLVKNGVKEAGPAMRDAAIGMTARINRNAKLRPHLRKLFVELTGRQPE
jgi:multiple sugar transport system substrate-binding protein